MISNADFADLFPWMFKAEPCSTTRQSSKAPSHECLARWEDDGGRPATLSSPASKFYLMLETYDEKTPAGTDRQSGGPMPRTGPASGSRLHLQDMY